jgi:hypothetical protein
MRRAIRSSSAVLRFSSVAAAAILLCLPASRASLAQPTPVAPRGLRIAPRPVVAEPAAVVVDHSWCSRLDEIPAEYVAAVKRNTKVLIVGQSHSHQLKNYGLQQVQLSNPDLAYYAADDPPIGSHDDGLDVLRGFATAGIDHVYPAQFWGLPTGGGLDDADFYKTTVSEHPVETILDANPGINVVMHVWCQQLGRSTSGSAFVRGYLDAMTALERAYGPGGAKGRTAANAVTFVYVTGHSQFRSDDPTTTYDDAYGLRVHINNTVIREYCRTNKKVLFDFGDMDVYCPYSNGVVDADLHPWIKEPDRNTTTQYDGVSVSGSFPVVFQQGWGWYDGEGSYAHTTLLHCRLKTQALWKLLAVLQGWRR